jgi:hypothetical protein
MWIESLWRRGLGIFVATLLSMVVLPILINEATGSNALWAWLGVGAVGVVAVATFRSLRDEQSGVRSYDQDSKLFPGPGAVTALRRAVLAARVNEGSTLDRLVRHDRVLGMTTTEVQVMTGGRPPR